MTPARVLSVAIVAALACVPAAATDLRVLSFNIYGGGVNDGKPVDETVAVIRATGADIIGVQETRAEGDPCDAEICPPAGPSAAGAVAAALGFHVYEQTAANPALWANAVISRYPIEKASANDLGVKIDVDGREVWLFNIHLDDSPYQPYQLLDIEYGPFPFLTTAEEAIAAAVETRGPAIDLLERDMAEAAGAAAVFVTGDFNEPSHLDWTEAAAAAGLQPMAVAYPTVLRIEGWGFADAYRAVHPDPVARPAMTWTPTSEPTDPEDHHDRIDFVLARGAGLKVTDAAIVGEKAPEADLVVTPWPSDHRAVVAGVRF